MPLSRHTSTPTASDTTIKPVKGESFCLITSSKNEVINV
jgi:hypothetical protein